MSVPTIVTTRSITLDSGSMNAPTSILNSPTPIQRYSVTVVCSLPPSTSMNTPMEMSAESATAPVAIQPVRWPSQRRPKRPLMRNAANGNAGTSQTYCVKPLALHRVDLVHVHCGPVAVRREDDGETDGH